jgi:predicted ribonuclease YlaK
MRLGRHGQDACWPIAAGMTKSRTRAVYQKLLCARPIMPLGRDIGYLPGDKDQKLRRVDAADLRQHGPTCLATS